jgi:hypothetical protein
MRTRNTFWYGMINYFLFTCFILCKINKFPVLKAKLSSTKFVMINELSIHLTLICSLQKQAHAKETSIYWETTTCLLIGLKHDPI